MSDAITESSADKPKSGTPVVVEDVQPPRPPNDSLDALTAWLEESYPVKRKEFLDAMSEADSLRYRSDIVRLGFAGLKFRAELDRWLAEVQRMIDMAKGDQLSIVYKENQEEAAEKKLRRPSADLVKAQAAQLIAPLARVQQELKDTQDLINKTISWSQSLLKVVAEEEFGELFSASNEIPEDVFHDPPSLADSVKRRR